MRACVCVCVCADGYFLKAGYPELPNLKITMILSMGTPKKVRPVFVFLYMPLLRVAKGSSQKKPAKHHTREEQNPTKMYTNRHLNHTPSGLGFRV